MKEFTEENKQLAYLILQNKYLQLMEKDYKSESEILSELNEVFPEDWTIKYDIEKRIELLGKAIKEKRNVIEIVEEKVFLNRCFGGIKNAGFIN